MLPLILTVIIVNTNPGGPAEDNQEEVNRGAASFESEVAGAEFYESPAEEGTEV